MQCPQVSIYKDCLTPSLWLCSWALLVRKIADRAALVAVNIRLIMGRWEVGLTTVLVVVAT